MTMGVLDVAPCLGTEMSDCQGMPALLPSTTFSLSLPFLSFQSSLLFNEASLPR